MTARLDEIRRRLANRICIEMARRHLNYREAAAEMGISHNRLWRMVGAEREEHIPRVNLDNLWPAIEWLGVRLSALDPLDSAAQTEWADVEALLRKLPIPEGAAGAPDRGDAGGVSEGGGVTQDIEKRLRYQRKHSRPDWRLQGEDRLSRQPPRPPALWAARDIGYFEGPWGAFPRDFIPWACQLLHARPQELFHVCSGGVRSGLVRIDRREMTNANVRADGRSLPLRSNCADAVLIDPPYSKKYAHALYETEYPRPKHLLAEAARVTKPCGRIGIVHFLVPATPPGCQMIGVRGITTGANYRIRAFTVYEKRQDELPMEADT